MRSRLDVIWQDDAGFVHYSYLLLVCCIAALLVLMLLENKITVLTLDGIGNNLTDAVLYNIEYDYESMYKEFTDENSSYYKLSMQKELTKISCVIKPQETAIAIENTLLGGLNLSSYIADRIANISVRRIIIYNVGDDLNVTTYENGVFFVEQKKNYIPESVTTPNDVPVKTSCVYAELVFDIKGITGIKNNLSISRCVEITDA